jgi:hypothetical protein
MGPTVTAMPDGGKELSWYSSRIPGVVEEILFSLNAGKPIYLCGAFGGATSTVIELLQGRCPSEFTWERQKQAPHAEAMRDLYSQHNVVWQSYEEIGDVCANIGVRGLSQMNHLSDAENLELFNCRDLPRLIELLVAGLARQPN